LLGSASISTLLIEEVGELVLDCMASEGGTLLSALNFQHLEMHNAFCE
jgi:hypothetical protein